jgi:hypothetical protein
VRARSLWGHKVRSGEDVRAASAEQLARVPLIGPRLAQEMKRQAEGLPAQAVAEPEGEEEDLPAGAAPEGAKARQREPPKGRGKRQRNLGEWRK